MCDVPLRVHLIGTPLVSFLALVLAACGSPSSTHTVPFTPSGTNAQVVLTSGDQSMLLQAEPPVLFGTGGNQEPQVITVNESMQYQTMDGFGASLTDSSAWLLSNNLDAAQRNALMQRLFSPTEGIGLSLLRQPMGSSDFAVNGNYSYDDVPAGQTDPQLNGFSIGHDTAYIIPLLQQALTINPAAKVVAVPWSPPAWMKASQTMNGGEMQTAYFSSLGEYFVLFLQAYQKAGIPIYAISVQNEPLNSNSSYPSEHLAASDEANFIANYLGPALKTAGLGVRVFAYEHNWDNTDYPESVLASPASPFVAGSSFHCYKGMPNAQSAVKDAYPAKDIWFTECSGTVGSNFAGDLVWDSENLLIGATKNWARSVSFWNLALDQHSGPTNGGCLHCRGVVTIDNTTLPATITYNVEYYVLGHLAKFVVPGAFRIQSDMLNASGIDDVAFQNPDGSIVLFALNSATASQTFSVSWKNSYFNYTLPPQSAATFTWK